MALGARSLVAVAIVAAVVASALPSAWAPRPWPAAPPGRLAVYVAAPGGRPLRNASISIWAFYPTGNGTAFQAIYNGTGEAAYVSMSSLRRWAEAWIEYYGPAAGGLAPPLLVFVSYSVRINSTAVEVLTQQFAVPLDPGYVLAGRGYAAEVVVDGPSRLYYAPPGGGYPGALDPRQPTTTTTTASAPPAAVTSTSAAVPGLVYYVYAYAPHVISWYPNSSGMAPIALATIVVQRGVISGDLFQVLVLVAGGSFTESSFNFAGMVGALATAAAGGAAAAAAQALDELSQSARFMVLSYTTSNGEVWSSNLAEAFTWPAGSPDVGQVFIVGRLALVNWTIYFRPLGPLPPGRPVGWREEELLTAVKVAERGGVAVPAIYYWEAYDPCVNLTLWAREYEEIESGGLSPREAGEVNRTCPLPNPPAPVNWTEYARGLRPEATVAPGAQYSLPYSPTIFYIATRPAPANVRLGEYSALAAAVGAGLAAAGLVAPAIAALSTSAFIGPIELTNYSVVAVVGFVEVQSYRSGPIHLYIFNDTPVYYVGAEGVEVALPRLLVFANISMPRAPVASRLLRPR